MGEFTSSGGALVIIIGINLLGLKKIKTSNFMPALLITIALILLEKVPPFLRH